MVPFYQMEYNEGSEQSDSVSTTLHQSLSIHHILSSLSHELSNRHSPLDIVVCACIEGSVKLIEESLSPFLQNRNHQNKWIDSVE